MKKTTRRWTDKNKDNKGVIYKIVLWLSERCFSLGWWLAEIIGEVHYQEMDENDNWVDVKED